MRLGALAIVAGLALAGGSAAADIGGGAATVFGGGQAKACYVSARDGLASDFALDQCTVALKTMVLTRHDRAATYINRGVIRLHRKEAALALADFDAAVRVGPDLGEGHVDRGAALVMMRDYEGAIAEITKGLEMGAAEPQDAHFNRAIAYEALGDLRAAYEDYKAALAIKPDWALPQRELARFTVTTR